MTLLCTIRPPDFFYWLQGFFEIDEPTQLDKAQCERILFQLQLVNEEVAPAPVRESLAYIRELCFYSCRKDDSEEYRRSCEELKCYLNSVFEHHVDPTYEGDQEYFLAVHRGTASV